MFGAGTLSGGRLTRASTRLIGNPVLTFGVCGLPTVHVHPTKHARDRLRSEHKASIAAFERENGEARAALEQERESIRESAAALADEAERIGSESQALDVETRRIAAEVSDFIQL
jgi:hypothetical protein